MAEHQPAFGHAQRATPRQRSADGKGGFWHRPEWMNLVSDALLLGASIAFGYALVRSALSLPVFAFKEVWVATPLSQVTHAQLQYAAQSGLQGNFFSLRLDLARAAFEKLPWVRNAQVRRVWPGTLEVRLEEHVATAYWKSLDSGDTRLVNQHGEIFAAASNARMPAFSGPEGRAAEVLERYREFSAQIAPLNLHIAALNLSPREAWQIRLSNGAVVELGREQAKAPLAERLARFVQTWPVVRTKLPAEALVADLRYPSGFAVRTAPLPPSHKGKQ